MGNRVLVLALFAALAAAPLPAGAVESVRPLRTVSFDFDLHVATVTETPGGGVSTGRGASVVVKGRIVSRGASPTRGSGESAVKRTFSAKGSIVVEVIQATEDSGLVVDVAENAIDRSRPKVRMAIGPDGLILFDPKNIASVTEEELAVARWMARGFYGDRPTDPGTSWTNDQSSTGRTDLEHYKVVERDAHRVTLDYSLDEKVAGVSGYEATRAGSLVYDTALVVPLKASFQTESRRQVQGSYDVTHTTVALTLTADTFATARKP
ncbi:MAG TPA: hypothetical protein VGX96_17525 [Candidatus Elarobacter sp.]|jgi:hypothetical protein|nr:hypothetical protein [Candidatus Elarobacter sp.]